MYKRICEGLTDIGKYIPKTEDTYKHITGHKDAYTSIYYYSEEQVREAEKIVEIDGNKRPRGISGMTDVVTDKLVWDFDSEKVIDAKRDAISLVLKLKSQGLDEDDIRICFSGSKGFAVEVQTNQQFTPAEFKAITKDIAKGLSTYDSVVANPSRIFRLPKTKHNKSGLYKIPLYFDELKEMSVEQIKEAAKIKPKWNDEVMASWKVTKHTFTVPETPTEKPKKDSVSDSNPYFRVDYTKNPFKLIPWKLAISQGIFPNGCRNDALMILGATLKAKGMDRTQCYYALKASADKQSEVFGQDKYGKDEIWKNIITPIYSALWNGATYSTANFPEKLRQFYLDSGIPEITEVQGDNKPIDLGDLFGVFSKYAENIDKNTVRTGIKELDQNLKLQTQMLVGLVGVAGSGKTSLALQIMKNLSVEQETSMFFSMDMSTAQVYEKLARSSTEYGPDQIMRAFKNDQKHVKDDIKNKVIDNYENVKLNFRTAQTVADMKASVEEYEQSSGKKVRLVVVDYLEKLGSSYSDPTVGSGQNAKELQDLAKSLDCVVLVLLQTQKSKNPGDPILSMRSVKGSSLLEQEMRVIISCWRDGYDPAHFDDDKWMSLAILKNTMGSLGQVDLRWNGERGIVRELSPDERQEMKDYKKQKETLKNFNDGLL